MACKVILKVLLNICLNQYDVHEYIIDQKFYICVPAMVGFIVPDRTHSYHHTALSEIYNRIVREILLHTVVS